MKKIKIIIGIVIAVIALAMFKTKDAVRDENGNFDRMAKIKCVEGKNVIGTQYQCNQLKQIGGDLKRLEQFDGGNLTKASQYYKDYHANEARADSIYKNKAIYIEGIVSEISKDILDEPYLMLGKPDGYSLDWVRAELADVHFSSDDMESNTDNPLLTSEEKSIKLNKGDKITMTCKGETMYIGIPRLEDCIIE